MPLDSVGDDLVLFASIEKIDAERREVYGYASTEARDAQGEIVTKDAIRNALPEYMQWGNVREMHGPSAVGTAIEANMDDKGLWFGAKVVDDRAWKKVQEKVYKGFSVGGKVTGRDPSNPKRITGVNLTEISLVDRPANPQARFELIKRAPGGELLLQPMQKWDCGCGDHQHIAKLEASSCMAMQASKRLGKFNDDQPRDDHGKWTSGGGSDGAVKELHDRIAQPDGGFTWQPKSGEQPTTGFAVSPYPDRSFATDVKALTVNDLFQYAAKNVDLFEQPDHFMGAWHDPSSGKVFLDVSVVKHTPAEAHAYALSHDQKAYFDFAAGKSVEVNPHATSGGVIKGAGHERDGQDAVPGAGRQGDHGDSDRRLLRKDYGPEGDAGGDRGRREDFGGSPQQEGLITGLSADLVKLYDGLLKFNPAESRDRAGEWSPTAAEKKAAQSAIDAANTHDLLAGRHTAKAGKHTMAAHAHKTAAHHFRQAAKALHAARHSFAKLSGATAYALSAAVEAGFIKFSAEQPCDDLGKWSAGIAEAATHAARHDAKALEHRAIASTGTVSGSKANYHLTTAVEYEKAAGDFRKAADSLRGQHERGFQLLSNAHRAGRAADAVSESIAKI